MFEDALFGHVRGAYTGALADSLGFLREANGGTAFFDEISGLPLPLQAKLLRAIETGVFRPIGATRDARSDFRVVAATNERLTDLSARGVFRPDLRHRLSGVVIKVPSLAERVDDIPELARHFLRSASGTSGASVDPPLLHERAAELLMRTRWSGNVRELRQVIDTAAAFALGVVDEGEIVSALAHRSESPSVVLAFDDATGRGELVSALRESSWDVERAASRLGLHRATLYRRMKRHGIETPRFGGRATIREVAAPLCDERESAG